jgi:hypothetical protein
MNAAFISATTPAASTSAQKQIQQITGRKYP